MLNKLVISISKRYDLSKEEILELLRDVKSSSENIPISIFIKELSALETIVKYLREEYGLKFSEIGRLLNRDPRTIWSTYSKAQKKYSKKLVVGDSDYFVSVKVFRDRIYGVLEGLVHYLKDYYHLKFSEIGRLLNRDQRTIWTVYQRYKRKEVEHE